MDRDWQSYKLLAVPVCVASVVVVDRLMKWRAASRQPLPPGPKPSFFTGNLFDLPSSFAARTYIEWGKKYDSDILHATALGDHIIILNKAKDAEALLNGRSRIYSDRPFVPMMPFIGFDSNTGIVGYSNRWRAHRKVYQDYFRPTALPRLHPLMYSSIHDMMKNLLHTPDDFMEHIRLFSVSVPLMLMYGYKAESHDDPAIVAAEKSIEQGFTLYLPGATLANLFPILLYVPSWFPGAGFKRKGKKVRALVDEAKKIPFDFVQEQYAEGKANSSVVYDYVHRQATTGVSPEEGQAILDVAYTAHAAVSDTTTSGTQNFIYAMVLHPEVQRKAQQQLDEVVGHGRLPTLADRPNLPYLEAIYRELIRWKVPAPVALPHVSTQDDHYKGYFIPKGSIVIPNIEAMSRDESIYPDPERFFPERHLNEQGEISGPEDMMLFGFGRRGCAGKYFASDMLFLVYAQILATFDMQPKKDENGVEIPICHDMTDAGVVYNKSPFVCSITPRSEDAKSAVLVN